MFKSGQPITLRRVVTSFIIVLGLLAVWYIATHGFIVVTSVSKNQQAVYMQYSGDLSSRRIIAASERNLVASGKYGVSIPATTGGFIIRNVEAPRFLTSISPNTDNAAPLVETLGRNALPNVIMTKNGLATSSNSEVVRPVLSNNITNDNLGDYTVTTHPEFLNSRQLNKQTISGVVRTSAGIQPVRYDTVSGGTVSYPVIETDKIRDLALKTENGNFSIFNKKSMSIVTYGASEDDVSTIQLGKSSDISENDGKPLYSIASNRLAIVSGRDFQASNDNKQELGGADQKVTILDTTSKQRVRELQFNQTSVLDVSLSSDAKSIAIRSINSTGIYSLESGDLSFLIPYAVEDFLWTGGSNYLFTTKFDGIFSGSMTDKTAQTITPYSDIRPTTISFTDGDFVYFTGYSGAIDGAKNPDIYRVNLSKNASRVSSSLITKLPYQGEGYYIDSLGGAIVIQLTRYISGGVAEVDKAAKEDAEDYITSIIDDSKSYRIVYQYVDLEF